MNDDDSVIPTSWLRKRMTVEEVELENTEEGVVFGYLNEEWNILKSKRREGDEIWEFCSSGDSWKNFAGRAGFAVVRNGRDIDRMVTILN